MVEAAHVALAEHLDGEALERAAADARAAKVGVDPALRVDEGRARAYAGDDEVVAAGEGAGALAYGVRLRYVLHRTPQPLEAGALGGEPRERDELCLPRVYAQTLQQRGHIPATAVLVVREGDLAALQHADLDRGSAHVNADYHWMPPCQMSFS